MFLCCEEFCEECWGFGPIQSKRRAKKLALDLLSSAMDFADAELQKKIEDIDLDAIYKKMNLAQSEEFKDVPGLQSLVQKP